MEIKGRIWGYVSENSVIWWKDLKDWVKEWRGRCFREKGESLKGRERVESYQNEGENAFEPYVDPW